MRCELFNPFKPGLVLSVIASGEIRCRPEDVLLRKKLYFLKTIFLQLFPESFVDNIFYITQNGRGYAVFPRTKRSGFSPARDRRPIQYRGDYAKVWILRDGVLGGGWDLRRGGGTT